MSDVLAVGQVWIDEDGDRVKIIAIDDPPYPVQFKWKDGTVGRAPIDEFLERCTQPTSLWLARIATLTSERDAARRERDEARAEAARSFAEGRDAALANAAMKAYDMGHPDVRKAINRLMPDDSPAIPMDDERFVPFVATPVSAGQEGPSSGREGKEPKSTPAVQGEPPRCKSWCNTVHPRGGSSARACAHQGPHGDVCYCTIACRDAGRPLHSRKIGEGSPREGEQGRCGTCGDSLPVRPNYGYVATTVDGRVVTVPCPTCRGTRPPQGTTTKETP